MTGFRRPLAPSSPPDWAAVFAGICLLFLCLAIVILALTSGQAQPFSRGERGCVVAGAQGAPVGGGEGLYRSRSDVPPSAPLGFRSMSRLHRSTPLVLFHGGQGVTAVAPGTVRSDSEKRVTRGAEARSADRETDKS